VHTAGVVDAKTTASPEDAAAFSAMGTPPKVLFDSAPNAIVCAAAVTVTAIALLTDARFAPSPPYVAVNE
jgi:hypothetical protein